MVDDEWDESGVYDCLYLAQVPSCDVGQEPDSFLCIETQHRLEHKSLILFETVVHIIMIILLAIMLCLPLLFLRLCIRANNSM